MRYILLIFCYTQHGSFGGPGLDGDEYYSAGSDDFRAYVWKIPSTETLLEARETLSSEDWHGGEAPITTGLYGEFMTV